MKTWFKFWFPAVFVLITACSVMTPSLEQAAGDQPYFDKLLARPDLYLGQVVILGGYVLEVRNEPEQTRLVLLQTPLGAGREPKSQDFSQGRIIANMQGFLDPEVYAKGRKITLGGKVGGGSRIDQQPEPFPYVRIDASEIYLWPRPAPVGDGYYWPPYWYDPWWGYYPHPWYGYPHRVRHWR